VNSLSDCLARREHVADNRRCILQGSQLRLPFGQEALIRIRVGHQIREKCGHVIGCNFGGDLLERVGGGRDLVLDRHDLRRVGFQRTLNQESHILVQLGDRIEIRLQGADLDVQEIADDFRIGAGRVLGVDRQLKHLVVNARDQGVFDALLQFDQFKHHLLGGDRGLAEGLLGPHLPGFLGKAGQKQDVAGNRKLDLGLFQFRDDFRHAVGIGGELVGEYLGLGGFIDQKIA